MAGDTPGWGRRLLWWWALGCIVVAAGVTTKLAQDLRYGRHETERVQAARMDPDVADLGLTPPHDPVPAGVTPLPVHVGVYVESIPALAIAEGYWLVDCDIWFRWSGEGFEPEGFEVVDGWIDDYRLEERFTTGDTHYAMYAVEARISKAYDVRCFPRDNYQLMIAVEHPAYQHDKVRLVADEAQCAVSSRVHVPGYRVERGRAITKPHSYQSRRGDPRHPADHVTTYSQFRYAFGIVRPGFGIYLRLFQMLFVAGAVALLSLLIGVHDTRFLLQVGAMFAAVANSYVVNTMIPETGHATFADMTSLMNVGLIAAAMLQSTISLYLHRDREEVALARRFDRLSFWVLVALFLVINLVLLRAAGG